MFAFITKSSLALKASKFQIENRIWENVICGVNVKYLLSYISADKKLERGICCFVRQKSEKSRKTCTDGNNNEKWMIGKMRRDQILKRP